MPKEVIFDNKLPTGNKFATQVTWFRENSVEIATINLEAEDYTPERGWFVFLDRNAINKIIKVLRRARDQAYGADE